ncbi:argininosuccinate lyase [Xylariaceae sp. FL1651]|nr:argininosuccinate lyase [Xylariaceae sp. FL1651]
MASDKKSEAGVLWGCRFIGGLAPLMRISKIYWGNIAFARANHKGCILTADEFQKIESGLQAVMKEWDNNSFKIVPGVDEDAGKLHTGRSRNERLRKIEAHLVMFLQVTAERAEREVDYVMPGYTHLQRARPVRWSHTLLSHALAPLECGALAGNPFGIERHTMARELGFEGGLLWNSMGTVADRDFVAETLQRGSMPMMHVSRWAEFGFALPSTYNTDLRESWEVMLDSVKTVSDSVQIATGVLATMEVRPDRVRVAVDLFMLATDITHHISGRVVALSEQTSTPMNELTYDQLKSVDGCFERDIVEYFDYERSVELRSARGGMSKSSMLEQI